MQNYNTIFNYTRLLYDIFIQFGSKPAIKCVILTLNDSFIVYE